MGGKGRRRREARRRARQQQEQRPERVPETENVAAGEPVHAASGAEAGHSRAARKRAKRGGGLWGRVGRIRVSPWLIAVPVLAIGTGILAVLIITSGSSGTAGGGAVRTPTPDPRVAGTPVATTIEIVAGDDGPANPAATSFFEPSAVTANAGEVVELVLKNEGSVTHNIWLPGVDEEDNTEDDWGPIKLIKPGETGQLLVAIDEPGTYAFKCEIHALVQFGTLVLQ